MIPNHWTQFRPGRPARRARGARHERRLAHRRAFLRTRPADRTPVPASAVSIDPYHPATPPNNNSERPNQAARTSRDHTATTTTAAGDTSNHRPTPPTTQRDRTHDCTGPAECDHNATTLARITPSDTQLEGEQMINASNKNAR